MTWLIYFVAGYPRLFVGLGAGDWGLASSCLNSAALWLAKWIIVADDFGFLGGEEPESFAKRVDIQGIASCVLSALLCAPLFAALACSLLSCPALPLTVLAERLHPWLFPFFFSFFFPCCGASAPFPRRPGFIWRLMLYAPHVGGIGM